MEAIGLRDPSSPSSFLLPPSLPPFYLKKLQSLLYSFPLPYKGICFLIRSNFNFLCFRYFSVLCLQFLPSVLSFHFFALDDCFLFYAGGRGSDGVRVELPLGFLSGLLLWMDVWIHAGGLWLGLVLGDLVEGHLLPQTGDALKDVKTR